MRYSLFLGEILPTAAGMTDSSHQAFLHGPPQPLVVARPQPDADPFELYRRLAPTHRPSFLFESANGNRLTARYSFLGSEPYLTLCGLAQQYCVEEAGRSTMFTGSAFHALGQMLGASAIPRREGIPPFFGGAVGYLSYDLIRSFESLPNRAIDDTGLPDLQMACFDLVAAVDHLTNQLYLMYCPPLSRFEAEPREKLYREGRDRPLVEPMPSRHRPSLAPRCDVDPKSITRSLHRARPAMSGLHRCRRHLSGQSFPSVHARSRRRGTLA